MNDFHDGDQSKSKKDPLRNLSKESSTRLHVLSETQKISVIVQSSRLTNMRSVGGGI